MLRCYFLCFKSSLYSLCQCTYIWHILLNNYSCHIANVSHTANMLNRHIDPTSLQTSAKKQPSVIHTLSYCHVCARYKYPKGSYGRCTHMDVPLMKSLQSAMCQGALYTYLKYITEQIQLPHCTYTFYCTTTVEYIKTLYYCTHHSKLSSLLQTFIKLWA